MITEDNPISILSCKRGVWLSYNSFQEDNGDLIYVVPYKGFVERYSPVYPHPCYMHLDWNGEFFKIKDVIPID